MPLEFCRICDNEIEIKSFRSRILCSLCKKDIENEMNRFKSDYRNNDLDPHSSVGKGYISEVLVAKFLNIKTCFDITGNFNHKFLYDIEDWGRINVKSSSLRDGNYHRFVIKKNIVPDFFFCIGYDKLRKHVIKVYIIPNEKHISNKLEIQININNPNPYLKFEETEKPWDDLFHSMKLENCKVLRSKSAKADSLSQNK